MYEYPFTLKNDRTVDADRVTEDYAKRMGRGVKFTAQIMAPENLKDPNKILLMNLQNVRNVHGMGFRCNDLRNDLDTRDLEALSEIPPDADILESIEWDEPATQLIDSICAAKGVQLANATKILCQKRPRFFPMIDSRMQKYLEISGRASAFKIALSMIREECNRESNFETLSSLESKTYSREFIANSKIRLFDVIVWMSGGLT